MQQQLHYTRRVESHKDQLVPHCVNVTCKQIDCCVPSMVALLCDMCTVASCKCAWEQHGAGVSAHGECRNPGTMRSTRSTRPIDWSPRQTVRVQLVKCLPDGDSLDASVSFMKAFIAKNRSNSPTQTLTSVWRHCLRAEILRTRASLSASSSL